MRGSRDRLDQVPLHRRIEGRLAAGHPVQGLLDLSRARVLGQVGAAGKPTGGCSRCCAN